MVQAVSVFAPNAIALPLATDGRPKFRLDHVAPANGFNHVNAIAKDNADPIAARTYNGHAFDTEEDSVRASLGYTKKYDTREDAAVAAIMHSWKDSIENNIEYGGYVFDMYYSAEGWGYTKRAGTATRTRLDENDVPIGGEIGGDWHVHGDYSVIDENGVVTRAHDPEQDNLNSDQFSDPDIAGIEGAADPETGYGLHPEGYKGFLGTPAGDILSYDPRINRVERICCD